MSTQNLTSFSFDGLIWKVIPDEVNHLLVVEYRNSDKHLADFSAIDLKKKKIKWQGIKKDEPWWIGLEAVKDGYIYLHGYKDIQNPEHKGIISVTSDSGKILWEEKLLSFGGVFSEGILALQNEEEENKVYFLLDLKTGKQKKEYSDVEVLKKLNQVFREKQKSNIQNALHFTQESEYFPKLSEYVQEVTSEIPALAFDYAEYKNFIIISYYIYSDNKLQNLLLIANEEGDVLLKEILDKSPKGVGMDTFFLLENTVIFVKEKKELIIYEL